MSIQPRDDPFTALVQPPPVARTGAPPPPYVVPRTFQQFYGLQTNPFADSVNPGFFYRTEAHAEAFRTILLAVEYEAALGLLTAPSGMGKTLVSQLLLQQLDPAQYRAAIVLITPGLGKTGLLREVLSELSVALPVGANRVQDLLKILSSHIIDLQQEGKRLVLLVDESHFLSADCLHIVRTLSNIEVPERKLVTCLLIGEERLSTRLQHASFDSLRNRIYLRASLPPLNLEDTSQYLKYRLMVSGRLDDLYTPEAMAAIHRHAGGICRSINKLGLLTLIEGAARQETLIEAGTVAVCANRM